MKPALHFVGTPKQLPPPPPEGRIVLLDLAFAAGDRWEKATRPFILAAGDRLAAWIDHHPHPAWRHYRDDPRFVLVDKQTAPACPQLVTPERVSEIGPVDHVFAHADFDGFVSAVKWLAKGVPPWPEADEDGRAIDAPGQGFVCSERGLRLADAIEWSRDVHPPHRHAALLAELAEALAGGVEPEALATKLDKLAGARRARLEELRPLLDQAEEDFPGILVLSTDEPLRPADKKFVLRELEARAPIAVLEEQGRITVATFDPEIRLSRVKALHGTEGFAWGKASLRDIRDDLVALLEER